MIHGRHKAENELVDTADPLNFHFSLKMLCIQACGPADYLWTFIHIVSGMVFGIWYIFHSPFTRNLPRSQKC